MSGTTVRGITKVRKFTDGNVIKVTLTNKQEFKGLYAGTERYNARAMGNYNRIKNGIYMIVYDVENKKPSVVDIYDYCLTNDWHIKEVGATRLPKALSDYLRAYHREYTKYQKQQKQAVEAIAKSDLHHKKLEKVSTSELPEDVRKELESDYYKNNPEGYIKQKVTSVNGFRVFQNSKDTYTFTFDFNIPYAESGNFGMYTYLEYDDSRHLDGELNPELTDRFIRSNGYPKVSIDSYKRLVNKHKKIAQFSKEFYGVYLDQGRGDRVYPSVDFRLTIKDVHEITDKELRDLTYDLDELAKQVSFKY